MVKTCCIHHSSLFGIPVQTGRVFLHAHVAPRTSPVPEGLNMRESQGTQYRMAPRRPLCFVPSRSPEEEGSDRPRSTSFERLCSFNSFLSGMLSVSLFTTNVPQIHACIRSYVHRRFLPQDQACQESTVIGMQGVPIGDFLFHANIEKYSRANDYDCAAVAPERKATA